MSATPSAFKSKAVRFHDELELCANKISELEEKNINLLSSLKNDTSSNVETRKLFVAEKCFDEIDVNNLRQRVELFDTVKDLQRSSATKCDEIEKTIQCAINKRKLESAWKQKRFEESRQQFETLHEKAVQLATNADPNRWLQVTKL